MLYVCIHFLSGKVGKPGVSIPLGTFIGIIFTSCISLLIVYLFGFSMANETLLGDKLVLATVAWPINGLVYTGICLSCVGGSLQSLLTTPRLLSAIASDGVLPFLSVFSAVTEKDRSRGSVYAVWLTWLVASIPCLAGYLDHLVEVISVLFLLMYFSVNVACFLLAVLKSPGFRPQFRYFRYTILILFSFLLPALVYLI